MSDKRIECLIYETSYTNKTVYNTHIKNTHCLEKDNVEMD